MSDIHNFNDIFIKLTAWYLFTISGPNFPTVSESHHAFTSSHLNNNQVIQNVCKLTAIVKTYRFSSLSKAIVICMEVLHRPQKEAIGLIYSLIELSNLSEVQRALKRDDAFKAFAIKYVQKMVKNEMIAVFSNSKLSMSSFKIRPNVMEEFSMLTIDNKHAKIVPIL